MGEETYQGWTNRETWAVALYTGNDQGWHDSILESLREARDWHQRQEEQFGAENVPQASAATPYHAGELIRQNVEDMFDSLEDPEMRSHELITIAREIGSLWRVNWTELGASFLEELDEL